MFLISSCDGWKGFCGSQKQDGCCRCGSGVTACKSVFTEAVREGPQLSSDKGFDSLACVKQVTWAPLHLKIQHWNGTEGIVDSSSFSRRVRSNGQLRRQRNRPGVLRMNQPPGKPQPRVTSTDPAPELQANGISKGEITTISSTPQNSSLDLTRTNEEATVAHEIDLKPDVSIESLCATVMRNDLGPRVAYLGPIPCFSVEQALNFVLRVHKASGQEVSSACLQHAVAVANILAELQMDGDTIIAGILHEVAESGRISLEAIEKQFGKAVARLIEGEAKVSRLPEMTESPIADENIENLRQMFIAMASDFRIIVIKLADRLHTMRSLSSIPPERQRRIARETLDIFAPLAHRLGIWSVKSELENLAFLYLYPEEYRKIRSLIEGRMPSYKRILEESKARLEHALSNDPILRRTVSRIEVAARSKEIYSIWQKLQRGRVQRLDHIYDLVALRVTLDPREDLSPSSPYDTDNDERNEQERARRRDDENSLCYYVLGVVHQLWHPVPGRVKDYIAFPKPNGYQSLHTTVVVDSGTDQAPLEVQIRTREMDRTAEYGMAAHWYFKEQGQPSATAANSWLSNIREWNLDVQSSHEFVELVRRELLGNRVFVFVNDTNTENATRILNLPRGSTVVDVAFAISTDAGYRMIAAKVNGSMVPMNYVLQNADMVQIVRSKYSPGPSLEWVQYAKTRLARHALQQFFASWHGGLDTTKQSAQRAEVDREAEITEIEEVDNPGMDYKQPWGAPNEELGAQWDRSQRSDDAVNNLLIAMNPDRLVDDVCMRISPSFLLFENGLQFSSVTAARCCLPLPGDDVFGLVKAGSDQIEIHRQQCAHGRRMAVQSPGLQKVAAQWQNAPRGSSAPAPRLPACMKVTCIDRNGLLSDVSRAIIERGVTILSTRSASVENTAYLEYCVSVSHRAELESLYATLRDLPGVVSVEDGSGRGI